VSSEQPTGSDSGLAAEPPATNSEHRQSGETSPPASRLNPFARPAYPLEPGLTSSSGIAAEQRNGHAASEPSREPSYEPASEPNARAAARLDVIDPPTRRLSPAANQDAMVPGRFDTVDPATRRLSPGFPGYEEPAKGRHKGSAGSLIREVLETVILAALIFLAVRAVVQNFKVEGSSMVPSFIDGEYMLVNKAIYSRIDLRTVHKFLPFVDPGQHPERYILHGPQHGDVIVFHPPKAAGGDAKDFIKRVIGMPGDTIEFRDTHVVVNGRTLIEPYIVAPTTCQGQFCHLTLGPNQYYVMGDNRTNSSDSRFWGPATADKIIGKALLIYWCGGRECRKGTDHIGLAPNHSPAVALPATPAP
jgi:signal peptidase I